MSNIYAHHMRILTQSHRATSIRCRPRDALVSEPELALSRVAA